MITTHLASNSKPCLSVRYKNFSEILWGKSQTFKGLSPKLGNSIYSQNYCEDETK